MIVIIAFKNTHYAISAEQTAAAYGIKVSVMPLPSGIKAGCGLCLRVGEESLAKLKSALSEEKVFYTGIYRHLEDLYALYEKGNDNG